MTSVQACQQALGVLPPRLRQEALALPQEALARAVRSLEGSGDWDYLTAQARLADRAELRRWCGRRLGDQAGGLFRYVLTGDPTDYCRALAAQERFTALRAWKNRVLHGRRGEE